MSDQTNDRTDDPADGAAGASKSESTGDGAVAAAAPVERSTAKPNKNQGRVLIGRDLEQRVLARWDDLLLVGERRDLQPARTSSMALRLLILDALAELERLDREAGGREARRAAIIAQGSIFARHAGAADRNEPVERP